MIERLLFLIFKRKKRICKSFCLTCEFYGECKMDEGIEQ